MWEDACLPRDANDSIRREVLIAKELLPILAFGRFLFRLGELPSLTEETRKTPRKEYLPDTHRLRLIDLTQAQETLPKQWGLVNAGEVLEASVPETIAFLYKIFHRCTQSSKGRR